jgi:hypothetical protein
VRGALPHPPPLSPSQSPAPLHPLSLSLSKAPHPRQPNIPVTPAKAGVPLLLERRRNSGIPAFAGMTQEARRTEAKPLLDLRAQLSRS